MSYDESHLLESVLPRIEKLCGKMERQVLLKTWRDLWLPLALRLVSSHKQLGRPFVQGVLGGQGTGKTTMCRVLSLILKQLGYRTLNLSLDDLYKMYNERLALKQQDPRLIWRGPPGTHDVEMGITVLEQIRQCKNPVAVPRFDKSLHQGAGDRTDPEIVENVDIVLFEGWFVGVRPISPEVFDTTPPPILSEKDKVFARDMNNQLHSYLPLWDKLDSLILLYPKDYRLSLEWRKQAERQMIATGKSGMSEEEVEQFVNYFWCSLHPELFIQPLVKSPQLVDLVIEINPDHTFGAMVNG